MPLPKLKDRVLYYGQQRTQEWHDLRLGKFTSSEIYKLMQKPRSSKSEFSASGLTYISAKAQEVCYGVPSPSASSLAIQWGEEWEPIAAEQFDKTYLHPRLLFKDDEDLQFIASESLPTGGSPDDLVDGMPAEYKCPYNPTNHFKHCQINTLEELLAFDKQKAWQLIHQMWLMRADGAYWCSFDPRLLHSEKCPHRALHVIEVEQIQEACDQIEERVAAAHELMKKEVERFLNQPAA